MKNEALSKYFIYFLILSTSIIVLLYFYEKNEIKVFLDNDTKSVSNEYLKNFENIKTTSELIYFNEFLQKDYIPEILAKSKNNELKLNLFNSFKKSYSFYKTFDIDDIKFYDKNAQFLLSMENKAPYLNTKLIENVLESSFDKDGFNNNSLVFAKPIFDDYLNLLGVICIEINIDLLFQKIKNKLDLSIQKLILINNDFEDENFKNLFKKDLDYVLKNIKESNEFALFVDNSSYIFIPIIKSNIENRSVYLLAKGVNENSNINKIKDYFDAFLIIILLILIVLLIVLHINNKNRIEKLVLRKKLDNIYSKMDLYVNMLETDKKGILTYVSKVFCDSCGYTQKELIGQNLNIIRHPDITDNFFNQMWKMLKRDGFWEGEIKNIDKYGNTFWIKGIIYSRYDYQNKLIGYGSIRVNTTDTKQLEKINKLLKEDLSNRLNNIRVKNKDLIDNTKVELMSKILDSISHQWKNPTLRISSELSELKSKINEEHIKKEQLLRIHNSIQSELKSLSYMLNEIKYLFNKNKNEQIIIKDIINELNDVLSNEFELNKISLKYISFDDFSIELNPVELRNILFNLLKNIVIQSTISNNEETKIYIETIKEDDGILIKIEDNLEIESKTFIDSILSIENSSVVGTNLGDYLYLCKLLVKKSNGIIWCEHTKKTTNYYLKLNSLKGKL
jgi:PAS domain S-box-containing protein